MTPATLPHLALVGKIANTLLRRLPANVERDDLMQVGCIAATDAERGWDNARAVPFSTYAAKRIRGAMLDELRAMDPLGRKARRLIKRMEVLAHKHPHPDWHHIALQLGLSFDEVQSLRGVAAAVKLLDFMEPDEDAPDGLANSKVVEAMATHETPETTLDAAQRRAFLADEVERLSPPQRRVIKAYLAGIPMASIAKQQGVTPSRISQLLRAGTLALARSAQAMSDQPARPEDITPPAREFTDAELLAPDIVRGASPEILRSKPSQFFSAQ